MALSEVLDILREHWDEVREHLDETARAAVVAMLDASSADPERTARRIARLVLAALPDGHPVRVPLADSVRYSQVGRTGPTDLGAVLGALALLRGTAGPATAPEPAPAPAPPEEPRRTYRIGRAGDASRFDGDQHSSTEHPLLEGTHDQWHGTGSHHSAVDHDDLLHLDSVDIHHRWDDEHRPPRLKAPAGADALPAPPEDADDWLLAADSVSAADYRAGGHDPTDPDLIRLTDRQGTVRLPSFQFDGASGRPLPVVVAVNRLLDADDDPWGVADWWLGANAWLDAVPAHLLGTSGEHGLLAAARAETAEW
ncbi:hypothetical protein ACIQ9P_25640 [Kitasatospora sp. NPDC094019]|uniref:hypothetical protein n=1 Tax=Kitasatospora sp. NPDC094019 TaxID=3364091 RepID=UPI0037FC3A34